MNKEKLERIKQELMKLPIVTKERILTKDELKAFLEWQYEAKKMSISYHIYDIQGNVEQNEKDSENFYLTISKSTPQTSETCQFLEDEKKQPLKRITFEGFEEDVERAMKNLEEYLNKQIIETRKVFRFLISLVSHSFILSFDFIDRLFF
jgi:transcriptional regulator of NAD metabolism